MIDELTNEVLEIERPKLKAYFTLSSNKTYSRRKAYTILNLLSDFGGFNDALFFILGILSTSYAARMYKASISQELSYSK